MKKVLKHSIWVIIASPFLYLAVVWNQLPDRIALHFDLDGKADRFGDRKDFLIAITVISLINFLAYILLSNAHRFDPKKSAGENKFRMQRIGFAIAIFVTAVSCVLIYSAVKADSKLSIRIIFAGIGFLLAFVGNYLYNIKPNYFAGIRLPWTLEDSENWRKTHLLAGKLFFAGGLLLALICLFMPTSILMTSFVLLLATMIIVPCVYSYMLYKHN